MTRLETDIMTQAALIHPLTFEEYVDFCSQSDERYELVQGELHRMTPPTWAHLFLAQFLEQTLNQEIDRLGLAQQWRAIRDAGQRTTTTSSRLPDVAVVPLEVVQRFINQTAILEVPAQLVIELVSPSSATEDYSDKVKEYEALGIPEYWAVDQAALGAAKYIGFPKLPTISVYHLVDRTYQATYFRGSTRLVSPTFPELNLTVDRIFQAGQL